ncbi:glycosyl transferase family 90-domain-containing protein [Geopyxis carbonaria]|nr:glycosyl transferase family 90-domain-containing protein [Geopyxis carbonaria]
MTVFLAQGKSGGQKAHLNLLFLSLAIFISITCVDLIYTHGYRSESIGITHNLAPSPTILSKGQHPITQLIKEAEERYTSMQNNQSKTLAQAVKEYQRRYKMNPPPHFDKWYEFAKERNVEVIDEYDTIYDSIKPFWGMPPDLVRKRAANSMGFKDEGVMKNNKFVHAYIRNGVVKISGQGPDWQKDATGKMIDRFAQWLPDMNLPFNIHDEPRVVVAHDMLAQHLKKADQAILSSNKPNPQGRFTIGKEGMISEYPQTDFNVFAHQGIWTHAIMSCAPDSPVRSIERVPDRTDKFLMQPLGFVANKTAQSDICLSPGMETSFGLFDRPNAFNVVQRLYPVFSQSKVSTFGDILYPSPWYWSGKVKYNEADDMPWENKTSALYWRGSTTGGYSRNGGWKRQHRQRVVSNLEADDTATILHKEKQVDGIWTTKKIPRKDLRALFDVHFSGVGQCDPSDCSQQREHFHVAEPAKQHDAWKSKYLLDVDGNAFSGRYHAFLESRSTVFKLAIFREWHDEWLHPWVHYVPVSLNVEEVAEIMRFFVHEEGGDAVAKRIADEGRRWAKKVLRNEAMDVWFFRLLLEYGRVIDDERDTIGFTL